MAGQFHAAEELAALARSLNTTFDTLNKPDPDVESGIGPENDPRDAYTNPSLPPTAATRAESIYIFRAIDASQNTDIITGFKNNSKRTLELHSYCGHFAAYSPTVVDQGIQD